MNTVEKHSSGYSYTPLPQALSNPIPCNTMLKILTDLSNSTTNLSNIRRIIKRQLFGTCSGVDNKLLQYENLIEEAQEWLKNLSITIERESLIHLWLYILYSHSANYIAHTGNAIFQAELILCNRYNFDEKIDNIIRKICSSVENYGYRHTQNPNTLNLLTEPVGSEELTKQVASEEDYRKLFNELIYPDQPHTVTLGLSTEPVVLDQPCCNDLLTDLEKEANLITTKLADLTSRTQEAKRTTLTSQVGRYINRALSVYSKLKPDDCLTIILRQINDLLSKIREKFANLGITTNFTSDGSIDVKLENLIRNLTQPVEKKYLRHRQWINKLFNLGNHIINRKGQTTMFNEYKTHALTYITSAEDDLKEYMVAQVRKIHLELLQKFGVAELEPLDTELQNMLYQNR